jgi:cytochrome P450
MANPIKSLERSFREYGDLYTCNIVAYGKEVVCAAPDLVKQIFTGDPEVYHAGEPNSLLGPVVGSRSVLLLDGREHHRQRKLLLPPFHGERMASYASVMREVADRAIDGYPLGETFPILPSMQRITFDVILETVFGAREGEAVDALRTRLLALVDTAMSPLGMLWLMPAFQKDLGPLTGWAKLKRSIAAADEAIYGIIAEARAAHGRGPARGDILSMLVSAVDEEGRPMSDQELRDELITMLLAGHETTATALAWAVEEIVRRPAVLEKILAEVGAAPSPSAPLPYLDAAVKEVLRMRPLAPNIVRKTTAPIKLRDHEIPAGTYIVISVYNLHHNPAVWDAPHEFRPERFLDSKPDPYAWVPFGGGARRCIGNAFALFEMRVVLATLLPRVRLRLPGKPAKVTLRTFLFAPEGGTKVVVEERLPAPAPPPPVRIPAEDPRPAP